jgi:AcrR family transcriptional regulator
MPITGPDLRSERRAAEVTTRELSARMGVSRATLYTLEKSAVITIERASQYRRALNDAIEASREKIA